MLHTLIVHSTIHASQQFIIVHAAPGHTDVACGHFNEPNENNDNNWRWHDTPEHIPSKHYL
jgi:hypothetical protein